MGKALMSVVFTTNEASAVRPPTTIATTIVRDFTSLKLSSTTSPARKTKTGKRLRMIWGRTWKKAFTAYFSIFNEIMNSSVEARSFWAARAYPSERVDSSVEKITSRKSS